MAGSRPPHGTSRISDADTGYGWISILLHWVTAVTVIPLWFIGKGIMS